MLSREEEIINTYLDGYLIKEISNYFSFSEYEITRKIVQYRTKRIMKLAVNLENDRETLNLIEKYIEESIIKVNNVSEVHRRRRFRNIIKLAEDGTKMATIGRVFDISRERVRQLINIYSLELLIVNESKKMKECEVCGKWDKNVKRWKKYKAICDQCCDKIIENNKKRWSRKYDKCIDCGTTIDKHYRKGRCQKCDSIFSYHFDLKRKEDLKKYNKKWRNKNIEKVREMNKRTADRVKRGLLDGNRELALKRDKYKCSRCGMSAKESLVKYKKDLFVSHIKDVNDNKLDNLITLCPACHNFIHSGGKNRHI
ncbi:MAG: HNH endonuclease signature motif containing protein [Bacilli bacterium]|nr:HNH endonuclease [Bacilli bacterium]